jgi:hypothetical protein
MIIKFTLTVLAFLGFLGVAQAQSGFSVSGGSELNGSMSADVSMAADPGWKYVHATNCSVYSDGSTAWLYVFPQEGGYLFTANPVHMITLAPACQAGNWIGIYVYDFSGNWNQILTYSYK